MRRIGLEPLWATFLVLGFSILLTPGKCDMSWQGNQARPEEPPHRHTTKDVPPDSQPQYFPSGIFSGRPGEYDFEERWNALYLRAMDEPSLLDLAKQGRARVFRLMKLLPYWHPEAVRIMIMPDGTGELIGKITDGAGGFAPGQIIVNRSFPLSKGEVDQFLRLINAANFWSMPSPEFPFEPPKPGQKQKALRKVMGGTPWILEGVDSGRYHVVARTSPEIENNAFAMAGGFMLDRFLTKAPLPVGAQAFTVPPQIANLVPAGYVVKLLTPTHLAAAGETLLVYERDEGVDRDPHLALVSAGNIVKDFQGLTSGCSGADWKEFDLTRRQRAAAVAFRCGADKSRVSFVIVTHQAATYEVVFRAETVLGRLDVRKPRPFRMWVLSARTDLDAGEACFYCPHRYIVKEFDWKNGKLRQVAEETPTHWYDPDRFAADPLFTVFGNTQ